jgi:hypothetical protein
MITNPPYLIATSCLMFISILTLGCDDENETSNPMAGAEMAGAEMAGAEMAGAEMAGAEMAGAEMAGEVGTCQSELIIIEEEAIEATYVSTIASEVMTSFGAETTIVISDDDGASPGTEGEVGNRFGLVRFQESIIPDNAVVSNFEVCFTPNVEPSVTPFILDVWGINEACGQWSEQNHFQNIVGQNGCTASGLRFSNSGGSEGDPLVFIDGTSERCEPLNPIYAREYLSYGVSLHVAQVDTQRFYSSIQLNADGQNDGPKVKITYNPCPDE